MIKSHRIFYISVWFLKMVTSIRSEGIKPRVIIWVRDSSLFTLHSDFWYSEIHTIQREWIRNIDSFTKKWTGFSLIESHLNSYQYLTSEKEEYNRYPYWFLKKSTSSPLKIDCSDPGMAIQIKIRRKFRLDMIKIWFDLIRDKRIGSNRKWIGIDLVMASSIQVFCRWKGE